MRKSIFILLASLLLASCGTESTKSSSNATQPIGQSSRPELPAQYFSIDVNRDTVLRSAHGTTLLIRKGCFVEAGGGAVSGSIRVSLKEARNPADIVLGNLHTITGDGKTLQTAGMIEVRATQGPSSLKLAEGKSVGVVLPASTVLPGMKLYQGAPDISGNISWNTPAGLLHKGSLPQSEAEVNNDANVVGEDGFSRGDTAKEGDGAMAGRQGPAGGDKALSAGDYFPDFSPIRGSNNFNVDPKTSYVFELKRLGWANIDRLYNERNLQVVDLQTVVQQDSAFSKVYITLAMPQQGLYLPGYQKKDGSFGFSHGDNEKMQLPVGAKATIIVTAYRSDELYYAIRPLSIASQELTIRPVKTTADAFRTALQAAL